MIDVLKVALAAANLRLRRAVISGEKTAPVREEIDGLARQIADEERRFADEHHAAHAARLAAIQSHGKQLAGRTLADLAERVAAFDLDA